MGLLNFFKRDSESAARSKKPATPFDAMGGEPAVHQLANRFYDIMSSDPLVADLYAIHPQPLERIRHVFYLYLMMWLGGPNRYEEERGHPRLRARHLSFSVTPALKEQWMYCMRKAMHETVDDILLAEKLLAALDSLAEHMVNQEDASGPR